MNAESSSDLPKATEVVTEKVNGEFRLPSNVCLLRHLFHPYFRHKSKGFMFRLYTSIITNDHKLRIEKDMEDDYLGRKEKLLPKWGWISLLELQGFRSRLT